MREREKPTGVNVITIRKRNKTDDGLPLYAILAPGFAPADEALPWDENAAELLPEAAKRKAKDEDEEEEDEGEAESDEEETADDAEEEEEDEAEDEEEEDDLDD